MSDHKLKVQGTYSVVAIEPTGRVRGSWLEYYTDDSTDWVSIEKVLPEHKYRIPKPETVRDEEERGILRISETVLKDCLDNHLRWLVNRVWSRLPACDRQVLTEMIVSISDQKDTVLPYVGLRYGSTLSHQQKSLTRPFDRATALIHHVSLAEANALQKDEAKLFVIARELAHVILRQPQMAVIHVRKVEQESPPREQLMEYALIEQLMTEQAVLQVLLWGFQTEYETYRKANPPNTIVPDWYRESFS